jgi:hypothetical protein
MLSLYNPGDVTFWECQKSSCGFGYMLANPLVRSDDDRGERSHTAKYFDSIK